MTDSDPNALIATERFMVENKDVIKIGSDIMVAPPPPRCEQRKLDRVH